MLRPSEAPQLTEFKCPHDNARVVELVNVDYEIMDVGVDPFGYFLPGFGARCTGHCFGNGNGRTWFYFLMSNELKAT